MPQTRSSHLGPATRAIHGQQQRDAFGSPHMPIYDTTTFAYPDTAALLEVTEGRRRGSLYSRYGLNPTLFALEETLAALEGAEAAWAFSSGMAAISTLFLSHGRRGIVCLGEVYGGTLGLLEQQLPELGIETHFMPEGHDPDTLERLLASGAGLVYLETPTNPTLQLIDIAAVAEQAHRHGALVAVDATFATPINQQSLALGADIVVHSATKYLGGHSDLTAGAVMGPARLLEPMWRWRQNLGSALSPQIASLLSRSLRTLPLRMQRHEASAQAIAEALLDHPAIDRVLYPGLPSHPGHSLARRQMRGFGGMLTLEIAGGRAAATAVADRLALFALAPSLGGAESLVTQPCTTSHADLSAEERTRRGISDGMLRLSVGLEDVEDLLADLHQALGPEPGN
ncbi:aminotransferase class I/II-fold pyridoxal phosphate-dependent enzyme [Halomonas sp. KAO]|uniref:trans-sulfuration enzyme family protein n=1 Tax=Halomonas sp. KAO TaxID=2783858 RepID=UPI00189C6944|nr:aminotransferase class I/II-fold pyridoxal phosphate-dependent enzyme [Halomonas sp. KAO]MBF7054725.1 aminotransferase class I/II-fold pyridoxal phosphate-dependent enzyme [Halomonas sp. KAO]